MPWEHASMYYSDQAILFQTAARRVTLLPPKEIKKLEQFGTASAVLQALDDLSAEGWELVSIADDPTIRDFGIRRYLLRRPLD